MRNLILITMLLAACAAAQDVPPTGDYVVICPIEGMIDDGISVVVERAVREARDAKLLVFVIDTPGGRVDSAIEITNSILDAKPRTVAFVQGMGAISAGAIISYACDDIVMAPATNIGASTPILMGVESSEAMDKKSYSFVMAKYRALGEAKGHPVVLGEAMVDPEIEVHAVRNPDGSYRFYRVRDAVAEPAEAKREEPEKKKESIFDALREESPALADGLERAAREVFGVPAAPPAEEAPAEAPPAAETPANSAAVILPDGSELVSAKGELLTLTTEEARRYGLAPIKAERLDDLLAHYGFAELRRVEITPNWAEALYAFLTNPMVAGLLLMCGVGGLYMEMRTPGFGILGIIGLSCLAVFFGAHLVVGLADWLDLTLVVIGLGLLAVEIFVLPGFGAAGAAGIAFIVAGTYMTLTRVPIPQYEWEYARLEDAMKTLSVAVILFSCLVAVTWRLLPRTRFFQALVMAGEEDVSAGYVVQTQAEARALLGMRGVAATMLRPAGRGRFEGKLIDVVTRGEFIEPGRPLEIIQVDGNRCVVTEREEQIR